MAERRVTSDSPAPGYREYQIGNARVMALSDAREFLEDVLERAGSLFLWARAQPQARTIQGRRPLWVVPWPPDADSAGYAVVRELHHGGLLAGFTGRRFLRGSSARPFNEIRIATILDRAGIPTPKVLAACVYPRGIFYSGDIARRWLPDTRDLSEALFGSAADKVRQLKVMTATGDLVGRLHRVGLYHPDLNLRNILVEERDEPRSCVIDLEKARIVTKLSDGKRRAMLDRLRRSARRFTQATGRNLTADAWTSFEEAYARHVR